MRDVENAASGLLAGKALCCLGIVLQRALFTEVVLAAGDHRVLCLCPQPPADEAGKGQLIILLCRQGGVGRDRDR